MGKRFLSVILICCLVCTGLIVPAKASEMDSAFGLINLLEYSFPNDSDSIVVALPAGSSQISFTLPDSAPLRYVDMFVTAPADLDSVSVVNGTSKTALTIEQVTTYNYRIFGAVSVAKAESLILEVVSASGGSITFYSLHYSSTGYAGYASPSKLVLEDVSATQTTGSDYILLSYESGTEGQYWWKYGCDVVNSDWRKYDYMSFTLFIQSTTFNSLTCTIAGQAVPFEISFVDSALPDDNPYIQENRTGSSDTYYEVTVTVDLTGVKRTLSNDLYISHYGTATTVYVGLVSSYGYIAADLPDAEISWLQRIWNTLTEGFQSVVDAVTGDVGSAEEFQNEVDDKSEELETMAGIMDSVDTPDDFDPEITISGTVNDGLDGFGPGLVYVITSPYIFPLIGMSLTLAFVSYALFGKRG